MQDEWTCAKLSIVVLLSELLVVFKWTESCDRVLRYAGGSSFDEKPFGAVFLPSGLCIVMTTVVTTISLSSSPSSSLSKALCLLKMKGTKRSSFLTLQFLVWGNLIFLTATKASSSPVSLTAVDLEYHSFSNTLFVTGENEASSSCVLASLNLWDWEWKKYNSYPFSPMAKCLPIAPWSQANLMAISSDKQKDEAYGHELATVPMKEFDKLDLEDLLAQNRRADDRVQSLLIMVPPATQENNGNDLAVFSLHQLPDATEDVYTYIDSRVTAIPNYWMRTPNYEPRITKYQRPVPPNVGAAGKASTATTVSGDAPLWSIPIDVYDVDRHIAPQIVHLQGDGTIMMAGSTFRFNDDIGGESAHGFLVAIDGQTGEVKQRDGEKRFRYTDGEDEWITGICASPALMEKNSVYLVGATTKHPVAGGAPSAGTTPHTQGFIKKIDLNKMESVWEQHWGATHPTDPDLPAQAYAMDCIVSGADHNKVFVVGIVQDGATIVESGGEPADLEGDLSYGGDDLWVASVDARFGSVHATDQIGSSGNQRLAPRNSIVTNYQGKALILGDTSGTFDGNQDRRSLKKHQESATDLFVIQWDSETREQQIITSRNFEIEIKPHGNSKTSASGLNNGGGSSASIGKILFIVCLGVLISFGIYIQVQRHKQAKSRRLSIYDYLQKFRPGDTRMSVSPTGGWNVTFTTKGIIANSTRTKYFGDDPHGIQGEKSLYPETTEEDDGGLRRRNPYLDTTESLPQPTIFERTKAKFEKGSRKPMELDGVANDAVDELSDHLRLV